MHLSQKPKKFFNLFFEFSKFRFNIKHFEIKDDLHS